jgi:subtilisin family serine protease
MATMDRKLRRNLMHRTFCSILLQLVLGLGFYVTMGLQSQTALAAEVGAGWDDWDVIPGRLLVKYTALGSAAIKTGLASSTVPWISLVPIEQPVERELAAQGMATPFISLLPDTYIGEFDPARRDEVINALAADLNVIYFEPDRIRKADPTWGTSTPNDPLRGQLWGMDRIGAPAAWGRQAAARSAIRVAVIEAIGRYDDQHRDLTAQNSAAQNDTRAIDATSHATHVSGIIAATGNNNTDVVGVANVELVALASPANMAGMAQQITWAVNNQVRVINMSWKWCGPLGCGTGVCSYPAPSQTEQDAITNAVGNIVFVAAASNDSCRADANGRFPIPASYAGVIGASALTQTDTLANFSNFGPYVALTAPGMNILSTFNNNATGIMSGTSMAAPHVAGSAAAVVAIQPTFDIRSISRLLGLTAEHLGAPGRNEQFGDGVVRVDQATAAIAEVYAETGAACPGTGTLNAPFCTLGGVGGAVDRVPLGGRIGLVRGLFAGPITIAKPLVLLSVGGTATIRP